MDPTTWPDVREYVGSYELRGDNGDYTPNERERLMIEDAIQGYIALINAAPRDADAELVNH